MYIHVYQADCLHCFHVHKYTAILAYLVPFRLGKTTRASLSCWTLSAIALIHNSRSSPLSAFTVKACVHRFSSVQFSSVLTCPCRCPCPCRCKRHAVLRHALNVRWRCCVLYASYVFSTSLTPHESASESASPGGRVFQQSLLLRGKTTQASTRFLC